MILSLQKKSWTASLPRWAARDETHQDPLLLDKEADKLSTRNTNFRHDQAERVLHYENIPATTIRRGIIHLVQNYLAAAVLLAMSISVLLAIYSIAVGWRIPLSRGQDMFPRMEYEERIFHREDLRPSETNDLDWATQGAGGFFVVDNPALYNLPPGIPYKGEHNLYGVSWAHQYHCMAMLRTEFWKLIANTSELVGVDIGAGGDKSNRLWHLAHCLLYVRQMIECNMDMTIEYPTLDGEENSRTVNGYGVPHVCKRREPLDVFLSAHAPDGKSASLDSMKHLQNQQT